MCNGFSAYLSYRDEQGGPECNFDVQQVFKC